MQVRSISLYATTGLLVAAFVSFCSLFSWSTGCLFLVGERARWDEALGAYERKLATSPAGAPEYATALLGKMRCLASLAEWDQLSQLCRR